MLVAWALDGGMQQQKTTLGRPETRSRGSSKLASSTAPLESAPAWEDWLVRSTSPAPTTSNGPSGMLR